MAKGKQLSTDALQYQRSAERIAEYIEDHLGILYGLVELRYAGHSHLVDAILQLPEIANLRTSWELVECLMEGDGISADEVMIEVIGWGVVDDMRTALWGPAVDTGDPAAA